jgi:2-iminoacetate synthase ThiH
MAYLLENKMAALTRTGLAVAGIALGIGAVVWGATALADHIQEQRRQSQQRCIERGGTVTVYAGGFTEWACEGMTKL